MSALASLERFGEEDPLFINWRSRRHCLQSEWPLLTVIVLVKQLFYCQYQYYIRWCWHLLFFIRWELPCKPYDPVCSGWISASSVMAFRQGVSKLVRFWAKNQHIQRKLLYFMNAMNEVRQKLGIVLEKKFGCWKNWKCFSQKCSSKLVYFD